MHHTLISLDFGSNGKSPLLLKILLVHNCMVRLLSDGHIASGINSYETKKATINHIPFGLRSFDQFSQLTKCKTTLALSQGGEPGWMGCSYSVYLYLSHVATQSLV